MIRHLKVANNVDVDNTAKKKWDIVQSMIRRLRMANSVDIDQTVPEGQSGP